jgi:glutamate synthase domain-containing protein 2
MVSRYLALQICIITTIILFMMLVMYAATFTIWASFLLSLFLCLVGIWDQVQSKHAILKNYPAIGHLRFWLERIRPEIRQYFIESDSDKFPFSRSQRDLVYQRSKNQSDQRPFGTIDNVYQNGYEWLS